MRLHKFPEYIDPDSDFVDITLIDMPWSRPGEFGQQLFGPLNSQNRIPATDNIISR